MNTVWQDVRFGWRMLVKQPAVTLIVALSIALGVGANTIVFTWMQSLILNPFPTVEAADRLVGINSATANGRVSGMPPISYPTYLDWRAATQSLEQFVAYSTERFNVRSAGEVQGEAIWGQMVSGNYFDALRVRPTLGRTFYPDEEGKAAPVAVISHKLWQRKFNGETSVINRSMMLNGTEVTIIGVAPPGFNGLLVGLGFDLWTPVTLQPLLTSRGNRLTQRGDSWLQAFGRLRDGVTVEQAKEEMLRVSRQISEAQGETPVVLAAVRRLREQFLGSLLFSLFSGLLVITALVLLTACANVANLLLARAVSRQKEISIRLALGANRWQIVRQLLAESILLASMGGLLGFLLALWAKDVFALFVPPVPLPVALTINMDMRVIGFAFLITLLTAVIFGLTPALRASKPELVAALKDEGRGATAASSKLRNALVVAQVALSLVALICAGLFLRSLQNAQTMELGFAAPEKVLLVSTDLNLAGLDETKGLATVDRLLETVRALPGVEAASFSTMVPLGFGGHSYSGTTVEGYTPPTDERISTERVIVSDDYFETMGIAIVAGRSLARQDRNATQRVVVVNETFAKRFWEGQDPIGKRLDHGAGWATVVGVAKDSLYSDLGEAPTSVVYSALPQRYATGLTLHLRTTNDPKLLIERLRKEFAAINVNLPFLDPRTLAEHISASSFVQFIGASMLSVFGVMALTLAAIGIYGMLSYLVAQRRRELGIRLALGASPQIVMRLIIGQGLRLTLIGLLLGGGIAFLLARLLQSQLVEIGAGDPLTFMMTAALVTLVALLACYLPARRAAKVDALVALRYE